MTGWNRDMNITYHDGTVLRRWLNDGRMNGWSINEVIDACNNHTMRIYDDSGMFVREFVNIENGLDEKITELFLIRENLKRGLDSLNLYFESGQGLPVEPVK